MIELILPIGIALFTPFLATFLAASKFKKEQKWQMKAESIKLLCEVLDRMILSGENWEKGLFGEHHLLKEDGDNFAQFRSDLIVLKTQASIVDILFKWDFSIKIDDLISLLEKEYRESISDNNPYDFSYVWQKEIKRLRNTFVVKAKKALK